MENKEFCDRLHKIRSNLKSTLHCLADAPLLSSQAVTGAQELRTAARDLEVLAIDLLNAQRFEAEQYATKADAI